MTGMDSVLAMQNEIRGAALPSLPGQASINAFDDVVALAELSQHVLRVFGERPLGRTEWMSMTECLQLAHSADLDPVEIFLALARLRPKIHHAAIRRRVVGKRPIQPGPTLRPNLGLQRMPNLEVRPGSEFQGQERFRPRPDSLANIVTRDDQILAIAGPATDNDMDVGVLGIPVIDGDPVEAGAQIAFGVAHKITGESLEIGKFGRVFGCDNEPEMMTVLLAPLCKGPTIDLIALSAKHPCRLTVFSHAVAAKIGEMGGKRGTLHAMTDDPGFDHC